MQTTVITKPFRIQYHGKNRNSDTLKNYIPKKEKFVMLENSIYLV